MHLKVHWTSITSLPNFFQKKLGFLYYQKCWHGYMNISSIFYFSKLTYISIIFYFFKVNFNKYTFSLWYTLKIMLFTKYLIKWKHIGRISWKFQYWFNLKYRIRYEKRDVILVQCLFKANRLENSKMAWKLVDQVFFSYGSKQSKYSFDQYLIKNCLAYLNSNAIVEFLGQFTIRCIYHFSKRCWIILRQSTKHAKFGFGVPFPFKVAHKFAYLFSQHSFHLYSWKVSVSVKLSDGLPQVLS